MSAITEFLRQWATVRASAAVIRAIAENVPDEPDMELVRKLILTEVAKIEQATR